MFRSKRKSNNNEDKINADGSLIKLRNVFKVYDTPAGRFTALNGVDLTESTELFIEAGEQVDEREVLVTPRIGVGGDAETKRRLWRFVWRKRAA